MLKDLEIAYNACNICKYNKKLSFGKFGKKNVLVVAPLYVLNELNFIEKYDATPTIRCDAEEDATMPCSVYTLLIARRYDKVVTIGYEAAKQFGIVEINNFSLVPFGDTKIMTIFESTGHSIMESAIERFLNNEDENE